MNSEFLVFRMMEVAKLLAGDKSWREDVDGLVAPLSSPESPRSLRARSGQNCGQMSPEGTEDGEQNAPCSEDPRFSQGASPAVRRI